MNEETIVSQETSDKASEKQIISNYFRELAKKSHEAVKVKYGVDYYKTIGAMKGKDKGRKRKVKRLKKVRGKQITPVLSQNSVSLT